MPSQATQQMLNKEREKLANLRQQAASQPAPEPQPVVQQQPARAPEAAPAPQQEPPRLTAPPPMEPAQPASAAGNGISPPALDTAEAAKLQQRIRTLEGVLEAERSVHGPAREQRLREQIADLEGKLNDAAKPVPQAIKLEDYFSPEQIAEEGVDNLTAQLKAFDKLADKRAREHAEPLERELKKTRQRQTEDAQAMQQRREDELLSALSAALPGWETWATKERLDSRFKDWLDGKVFGKTRQSLLSEAQANLDAPSMIEIMQEFLDSLSKGTVPSKPHSRLIPEGRGAGEDPPPPVQPYDFTESQVAQFRSDMSHGVYKKRGGEALQIMKRIQAAYAAGRIGPG